MSWEIICSKQAQKDARKLAAAGLKDKALPLLAILKNDPFQNPPPYEKWVGDLAGAYFQRINIMCRYRDGVFKSGLGPTAEVLSLRKPSLVFALRASLSAVQIRS